MNLSQATDRAYLRGLPDKALPASEISLAPPMDDYWGLWNVWCRFGTLGLDLVDIEK